MMRVFSLRRFSRRRREKNIKSKSDPLQVLNKQEMKSQQALSICLSREQCCLKWRLEVAVGSGGSGGWKWDLQKREQLKVSRTLILSISLSRQ
jgi:hypothetical protein